MASRKSVAGAASRSRQPKRAKVEPPILASARLMDRVLAFDALLPDPFAPIGRPAVDALFAEARLLAAELERLLKRLRARPGLGTVKFDFDFPSYKDFLQRERTVEVALATLPNTLFAFPNLGGPALVLADARNVRGDLQGDPSAAESGARKWIAKLFVALGLGELFQAVLEILEADGILNLIARAIRERDWRSLKRFLKMLLDFVGSRAFLRKLIEKVGQNAAARLVGAILGKCLPIVGWVLLIGSFVWAVAEQFL